MIPSFSAAWKLYIPTDQGFVLPNGALACTAGNTAAFTGGTPSCSVTIDFSYKFGDPITNTDTEYKVVTVSNLAVGNLFFYEVNFQITNPPTAKVIGSNKLFAQSFYDDGGTETLFETNWMATSIIISGLLCTNVPTLGGYSTTVGGSSSVTISYQLCTELPTGGFLVLQLPKLNSPYASFGASSTTSMISSSSLSSSSASVRNTNSG